MAEKKVLIVHGDPAIAAEISREISLVSDRFGVDTAITAPRALGIVASRLPDVIVVEAELEGVDGYTFCRQFKSEEGTADVPVVIVALEPTETSALKARQVGAAAHLGGGSGHLGPVAEKVASLTGVEPLQELSALVPEVTPVAVSAPASASTDVPVEPVIGLSPVGTQPADRSTTSAPGSFVPPAGRTTPVEGQAAPVQGAMTPVVSTPAATDGGTSGGHAFGRGPDNAPSDVPHVDELLRLMLERGGSDLHITVGSPPGLRLRGELVPVENMRPLTPRDSMEMILGMLSEEQRRRFETELELDFAYSIPGVSRFRCNVFQQRNSMGAVFRVIPIEIPTIDDLALPKVCRYLAERPRGLVLITGPTGSGKSTTLAAMIDHINANRAVHIITLEDPIEFMHRNKMSYVNQREVGEDTHSFAAALKRVLRQDPDVILVGEMRDLETISAAITAAETGHLVLATLHTTGGPESVDRIIDVFPPHQQQQVRMQLSTTLEGILSQTLLRSTDGKSRVMAMEIMLGIPAISNLIREGKTHQMTTIIQGGAQLGMQTLDQHLKALLNQGRVTFEEAVGKAKNPRELAEMLGRKL